MSELRVLFVCYGNTCRSPLAEGVFRAKVAEAGLNGRVAVDSAGTHTPDPGGSPHPFSVRVAAKYGLDIADLRGRRFVSADFDRFDRILVLDRSNRRDVLARARDDRDRAKVRLLRDADGEVADPIFGGDEDYERAYAEIHDACDRLLADVRAQLGA